MKVIYDTLLTSNENKHVVIEVIDNAEKLDLLNRFELRITIDGEVNTLKLTDETRRAIMWKPSVNSMRFNSVDKVDSLTYKDPTEVCEYEACEMPRFKVDFEGGSFEPVLTEEGERESVAYFEKHLPFLRLSTTTEEQLAVFEKERENEVGKAIAEVIEAQDTDLYDEWSNDMTRFK